MPDQDEKRFGSASRSESSGQTRPADGDSPPNDTYTSSDSQTGAPSSTPIRRATAGDRDDSNEAAPRSSRTKPSDTLRRSQACLACRKRKLRCDAKKPTCTRCEKAWLSYHPQSDTAGPSESSAPPCEYDTSLLSKIFKSSTSNEPPNRAPSPPPPPPPPPSAFRSRQLIQEEQTEQLVQENEQLRAQVAFLQARSRRREELPITPLTRDNAYMRPDPKYTSAASGPSSRVPVQHLVDDKHRDKAPQKRLRLSFDGSVVSSSFQSIIGSSPKRAHTAARPDDRSSFLQQPATISHPALPGRSRPPTLQPPLHSWSIPEAARGPPPPLSTASVPYRSISTAISAAETPPSTQLTVAPLPHRQTLERLIEICQRQAWLFSAINGYALSDVAVSLETVPSSDRDHMTGRALLMTTVAIALPILASAFPDGITTSPVFTAIDEMLRAHSQSRLRLELSRLGEPLWMSCVSQIYSDGARDLINQVQARPAGHLAPASLLVRIILVEISHAQASIRISQADLASAASEARLLCFHSTLPSTQPRLSAGPAQLSNLARALRGLMQSKQESIAFWSLFLQDCYQSRLAHLPVIVERQGIRAVFPRRRETETSSSLQHGLDEVEAYMSRRRGLPLLEAADTSMSLMVKISLVLDQCCEYAIRLRQDPRTTGRRASLQEEHDRSFAAAHESIRNSRKMLSHFDDQAMLRTDMSASASKGGRSRESLLSTMVLADPLRFAAEVTHHLSVLCLFETTMILSDPFIQAGEARSMICNASIWLSRLAGMALQDLPLLFGIPSFCSTAWFIAARWLLFLQAADPHQFHADISTLVQALGRRARSYAGDHSLAKAVVALKRERDLYGRICISPFTWPVEAISEFIPMSWKDITRGRQAPTQATEAGYVAIATLAASIDEGAIRDLASSASTGLIQTTRI